MALGEGQRGRRVGDVPHLGAHAPLLGVRHHLAETVQLGTDGGMPGFVGAGEVRPQTGDVDQPAFLGAQRLAHEFGPVGGLAAAAPEPGVGLELDPRGRPGRLGRRGDLPQGPHPAHRHVEVGLDGLPPRPARRPQPAHDPAVGQAGRAQREGLLGVAVPSQVAPASSAARAHGTAPWPYASDLTTAIKAADGAWARRVRTLPAGRPGRSLRGRAGVLCRSSRPQCLRGAREPPEDGQVPALRPHAYTRSFVLVTFHRERASARRRLTQPYEPFGS